MNSIGTKIKQRLDELGMTQEELAIRAKVSQSTVQKIISGTTKESRKIPRIANALNIDLEYHKAQHAIREEKAGYSCLSVNEKQLNEKMDDLFKTILKKYTLGELSENQIRLLRNLVDEMAAH